MESRITKVHAELHGVRTHLPEKRACAHQTKTRRTNYQAGYIKRLTFKLNKRLYERYSEKLQR